MYDVVVDISALHDNRERRDDIILSLYKAFVSVGGKRHSWYGDKKGVCGMPRIEVLIYPRKGECMGWDVNARESSAVACAKYLFIINEDGSFYAKPQRIQN